ncbi:hypothetical protein POM88_024747 [Heracleum sosnowskyi]|uniref:Uncharacterized protein n=1 Tax=Heracleum sosnowskyi TaxID=360622 RepID=A0AAD8MN63_9APIA|nr:hypothetical protein POM88_024747 [Heracleum sosnowskyi]
MRVKNKSCIYKSCTYGQPNFGVIDVNWDVVPVSVNLEVRDARGMPVHSVIVSLSDLQTRDTGSEDSMRAGEHRRHISLEVTLPWIIIYRLTILFFCTLAGTFKPEAYEISIS